MSFHHRSRPGDSDAGWKSLIQSMAVARLAVLSGMAMMGTMMAAVCQGLVPRTGEPIAPIPAIADLEPAKIRLGERLFHDARLSHDNKFSCASCHGLDQGGDDGQIRSIGNDGRPLDFNAPTVFN